MDKNHSIQKIKSQMDRKKPKGIAHIDKKNLSGQFFCPDNFLSGQFFCPDNFFIRTIFLSGPFFCPDNFFVRINFLSGQFFCLDNFFVWTIFLSGQKGIYHQVEFHRTVTIDSEPLSGLDPKASLPEMSLCLGALGTHAV